MRLLLAVLLLLPCVACAQQLEFLDGEVRVSISHSLHYGINYSVEKPSGNILYGGDPRACTPGTTGACAGGNDPAIADPGYYRSHGGSNVGANDDDARMAFGRGIWANQFKGKSEISASWGEFGVLARLYYFYDYEIMDRPRGRDLDSGEEISFVKDARREIGADIRTLDLNVSWDTYLNDNPLTVRVGDQVINWGQSTFLPGVGVTNPIDLNRLFSPGFELNELFKPQSLAFVSYGLGENMTVEAYYQYSFDPLPLPPGGSFMAINDYLGAGHLQYAGQGELCLDGTPVDGDGVNDRGLCITPAELILPPHDDQWGLRAIFTLPELNYTQVSLYWVRYHNRLPAFGGIDAGVLPNAAGKACADNALGTCNDTFADPLVTAAGSYLADLDLYGLSWSSNLPGGVSFSGEVSLKKDFPVQVSLPELVSALGYMDRSDNAALQAAVDGTTGGGRDSVSLRQVDRDGLAGLASSGAGSLALPSGIDCRRFRAAAQCDATGAFLPGVSVLGTPAEGYLPLDLAQAQFTLIKLWSQVLGGGTFVGVFEAIYAKVLSMPGALQFEKPDFRDDNNSSRADASGWGYRLLLQNEYSAIFDSNWSVKPTLVWFHDVRGSPPANTGTFLEDRQQAIFALFFNKGALDISLRYAFFTGARCCNVFQDRDTLTLDFKWSL